MIHSLTDTITLNEQVSIPGFGLGVFQIPDEEVSYCCKNGILKGYRLIDAAQIYDNESGTGQGIKEGLAATGLTREELFVTSKVWNNYLTYDETIVAFEKSLALLQLDYLDLYLLHWPGKMRIKNLGGHLKTSIKLERSKPSASAIFRAII